MHLQQLFWESVQLHSQRRQLRPVTLLSLRRPSAFTRTTVRIAIIIAIQAIVIRTIRTILILPITTRIPLRTQLPIRTQHRTTRRIIRPLTTRRTIPRTILRTVPA